MLSRVRAGSARFCGVIILVAGCAPQRPASAPTPVAVTPPAVVTPTPPPTSTAATPSAATPATPAVTYRSAPAFWHLLDPATDGVAGVGARRAISELL